MGIEQAVDEILAGVCYECGDPLGDDPLGDEPAPDAPGRYRHVSCGDERLMTDELEYESRT